MGRRQAPMLGCGLEQCQHVWRMHTAPVSKFACGSLCSVLRFAHGAAVQSPYDTPPRFRVGVVLVSKNSVDDVLVLERCDRAGAWQLPQGKSTLTKP